MLLPTLISMNKHGSELYFARFAFFFCLGQNSLLSLRLSLIHKKLKTMFLMFMKPRPVYN